MRETWVQSLCCKDPLEKEMAAQYSGLENSMDCIVHGVVKIQIYLIFTSHCNIQNNFTVLKIVYAPPIHLSLPYPKPWQLFIFLLSIAFAFCHIVRIIQYIAFPDWLLSVIISISGFSMSLS